MEDKKYQTLEVLPNSFDAEQHYYPRVLNAAIHPPGFAFSAYGSGATHESLLSLKSNG